MPGRSQTPAQPGDGGVLRAGPHAAAAQESHQPPGQVWRHEGPAQLPEAARPLFAHGPEERRRRRRRPHGLFISADSGRLRHDADGGRRCDLPDGERQQTHRHPAGRDKEAESHSETFVPTYWQNDAGSFHPCAMHHRLFSPVIDSWIFSVRAFLTLSIPAIRRNSETC